MKKRSKIGIVGVGWVGGILLRWLRKSGWRRGRDLFLSDADPKKGMQDDLAAAEIIFICVPTPSKEDGSCDTSMVEDVVRRFACSDKLLVIRSTVSPGTTESLSKHYGVAIAFNPEFLTEKNAWNDFVHPSRQIVGISEGMRHFHGGIVLGILPAGENMIITATEAETVKYFSNVFGALKVTFANVGNVYCEALGANYENVRLGVASDARIGGAWLDVHHGHYRGFGGYCFPKDTRAVIAVGEALVKKFAPRDPHFAKLLGKAIAFFRAAYDFNETLLISQGLTVEEVSGHVDDERMKEIERKNRK